MLLSLQPSKHVISPISKETGCPSSYFTGKREPQRKFLELVANRRTTEVDFSTSPPPSLALLLASYFLLHPPPHHHPTHILSPKASVSSVILPILYMFSSAFPWLSPALPYICISTWFGLTHLKHTSQISDVSTSFLLPPIYFLPFNFFKDFCVLTIIYL